MTMTMPSPNNTEILRARAKALHLNGLLEHWPEVEGAEWIAPLLQWEEDERAHRSRQRTFEGIGSDHDAGRACSCHESIFIRGHARGQQGAAIAVAGSRLCGVCCLVQGAGDYITPAWCCRADTLYVAMCQNPRWRNSW